jgi:hypothetical protein
MQPFRVTFSTGPGVTFSFAQLGGGAQGTPANPFAPLFGMPGGAFPPAGFGHPLMMPMFGGLGGMDGDGLPDGLLHQLLASFQPPSRPTPEAVVAAIPELLIDTAADALTNSEAGSKKVNPACPVCLEDFSNGEAVAALPSCGHRFHRSECLLPWLKEHDTCPICRERIYPDASASSVPPPRAEHAPQPAQAPFAHPPGGFGSASMAAGAQQSGVAEDDQWRGDDAELEAAIAASLLDVQPLPVAAAQAPPLLARHECDLDAILAETLASPSMRASAADEFIRVHALLPPPGDAEPAFTVKLKRPDGRELVRRFHPEDTLGSLLTALLAEDAAAISFDASAHPLARLRCPGTPAGMLGDWTQTLAATGLPRRVMLTVEQL